MQANKLTFIGAGNMATALISGLVQHGHPANFITASDLDAHKLSVLNQNLGIQTESCNEKAIADSNIILLAVKPQVMNSVLKQINTNLQTINKSILIVSIAAGISIDTIQNHFQQSIAVIRAMPNTPALISQGITALIANSDVSAEQKKMTDDIFKSVGETCWLNDEKMMDPITAISGSGPAYFFYLMEAMERAAQEMGIPTEVASKLVLQTAVGATQLASDKAQSSISLEKLREQVTSPGGTTEAAIQSMNEQHIQKALILAIKAASNRAKELSTTQGDS